MGGRLLLAGLGVASLLSTAWAQFPPPSIPPARPMSPPAYPATPRQLPRPVELPVPLQPTPPATVPAPVMPSAPVAPQAPRTLSPGVVPAQPLTVSGSAAAAGAAPAAVPVEVPLPHPETKSAIDTGSITLKRVRGGWQAWAGQRLLRDFADDEHDRRTQVPRFNDTGHVAQRRVDPPLIGLANPPQNGDRRS